MPPWVNDFTPQGLGPFNPMAMEMTKPAPSYFILFIFCGSGNGTEGLAHARQTLYH
jgi:hypothetical protein